MTHRIVLDLQTGITTQVEYTPEEQAIHDAAVAAQIAAAQLMPTETTTTEPTQEVQP
jgi:hypothetical protein